MGKLGAILYLLVLIGLSVHADDNEIYISTPTASDNLELTSSSPLNSS